MRTERLSIAKVVLLEFCLGVNGNVSLGRAALARGGMCVLLHKNLRRNRIECRSELNSEGKIRNF